MHMKMGFDTWLAYYIWRDFINFIRFCFSTFVLSDLCVVAAFINKRSCDTCLTTSLVVSIKTLVLPHR